MKLEGKIPTSVSMKEAEAAFAIILYKSVGGAQHGESTLESGTNQQTDGDGAGGGEQVINNGFQAGGANLLHVVHGQDAAHDGEQHQGHNTELDQVQENGTERLDVGLSEAGVAAKQDTGNDGQHQCNENLGCERKFLFHSGHSFTVC